MNTLKSAYIDILRIISALYVFVFHLGAEKIDGKLYLSGTSFNQKLGLNYFSAHFFVIIFFVLSGYLITMSALKKGQNFYEFIADRLGRLYSVLLPCIIICYIISIVLTKMGYLYTIDNYDNNLIRIILNLTFLTQIWDLCATLPLNRPVWSISYEFMYYLLISAIIFPNKLYKKVILICFICIIAGLKILLLFPVWLLGSALHLINNKQKINLIYSILIFATTLVTIVSVIINPDNFPFMKQVSQNTLYNYNLFFSWNYASDYIFGSLITLNLYSLFSLSNYIKIKGHIFYIILKKISNSTYTLYLFHVPLMIFFASVFPYEKENIYYNIGLIVLTVIAVYLIASVTEWKVNNWRNIIRKFLYPFLNFNNNKSELVK